MESRMASIPSLNFETISFLFNCPCSDCAILLETTRAWGSTDMTPVPTQKSAVKRQGEHLSMIKFACFTSMSGGARCAEAKHEQSHHMQKLKLPMTTEENLICLDSRSHSKII
jgi:hypothetical protein